MSETMRYFPKFTPKMRETVRVENQKGHIENTVNWFSVKMKTELLKHLDRPGWKREKVRYLWRRMMDEFDELGTSLANNVTRDEVAQECADIANFAMMIADVYREKP